MMKLKIGHTTSVQCMPFTIEWGYSQDARKIGALSAC